MRTYTTDELSNKSTKWLKHHCIAKAKELRHARTWIQTCRNHDRRNYLIHGAYPVSNSPSTDTTSTEPPSAGGDASTDTTSKNGGLEDIILNAISETMGDRVEDTMLNAVADTKKALEGSLETKTEELIHKVDERIRDLRKPIIITVGNKPVIDTGDKITHEKLNDVFECLYYRQKVMLVGHPGTGKSRLIADAWKGLAKTLDLDPVKSMQYIPCSAGLSEAQLLGKMDAHGKYHTGLAVDKFENGGMNLFDEADGFDPNVALVTHAMTDNQGYIALPNRTDDPMAFKHDHYYHSECANTWGDGMDFSYSGRMQQDGAKLDRFGDVQIFVDYDKNLERMLVGDYRDWASMLWDLRASIKKASLDRRYISTRRFADAHAWAKVGKDKPWFLDRITTSWTDEERGKVEIGVMKENYS